jgi:hypothetical protein
MKPLLIFTVMLSGIVVPLFFYIYIYLSIFHEYEFYWTSLIVIPVWFYMTYFAEKLNNNKQVSDSARTMYRIGSGFAWIWMASIPASIYFLIAAIFMDGSWMEFFYAALVGAFVKAVAREYLRESQK